MEARSVTTTATPRAGRAHHRYPSASSPTGPLLRRVTRRARNAGRPAPAVSWGCVGSVAARRAGGSLRGGVRAFHCSPAVVCASQEPRNPNDDDYAPEHEQECSPTQGSRKRTVRCRSTSRAWLQPWRTGPPAQHLAEHDNAPPVVGVATPEGWQTRRWRGSRLVASEARGKAGERS
jgi:hypothetical protein